MRLLIVEDEVDLGESLLEGLRAEGYAVELVHDGASALDCLQYRTIDLVLLDRNLPILGGDAVCRALTALGNPARILMLTAAAGLDDRVEGLDLGADDYLPKPFAWQELLARVRALGRRGSAREAVREVGDLSLDLTAERVRRNGSTLRLSPKEFAVLRRLVLADGGLVRYPELIDAAWDENEDPGRGALKAVVYALRRKLGPPDVIVAEPGRGYRIEAAS